MNTFSEKGGWWWGNNVAIVTRLNWNVRGLMSGRVLGNSGTRGKKNVPLMKPLEMMIETLMLGTCWLELHGNWATNYIQWILNLNNMRLPWWEHPVWAGLDLCSFVSRDTQAETSGALDEPWYLTPLVAACMCTQCAPFIFRGGCLVAGLSRVPEDFNEKDIAQTPSMFPPCIHQGPADSWLKRTHPPSWMQRLQACAPRHRTLKFIRRHLLLNIAQQC